MDNPLAQTLARYLQDACNDVLGRGADGRHVRLVVHSFPADVTFAAFERLDAHLAKRPGLRLTLKVGRALWRHWQEPGPSQADEKLLAAFEKREWVDHDDCPTRYRNLVDGTERVTVLMGGDRVLDKGSLDGFHTVDQSVLWKRAMKGSYQSWLVPFLEAVNIDPSNPALLEGLDELLSAIDKATPQDLAQQARFLQDAARRPHDFGSGSDVLNHVVQSLPRWGFFPLASAPTSQSRRQSLIAASADFAAWTGFGDASKRAAAHKRIEAYEKDLAEGKATVPEAVGQASSPFADGEAFTAALRRYIDFEDEAARAALRQVDFAVVQAILTRREKKEPKEPKDVIVKGPALQAFMAAIWQTAREHRQRRRGLAEPEQVATIVVTLQAFYHDLDRTTDDKDLVAARLHRGLLQGIEGFLASGHEDVAVRFVDESEAETKGARTMYAKFAIALLGTDEDEIYVRTFRWIVGPSHEERVLHNLASLVLPELAGKRLPAFEIGTYEETFFAADADEANRLLAAGEDRFKVRDLLDSDVAPFLDAEPALRSRIGAAATAYHHALKAIAEDGYFTAMGTPGAVLKLLSAVQDLYEQLLAANHLAIGDLGCALFKAFLIIPAGTNACAVAMPSAIATGLAPAVLEQLHARECYLRQAFPRLLGRLLADQAAPGELAELFGRVALHRPVLALLADNNPTLTTRCRGLGAVHLLGTPPAGRLALAAQANMREDDIEDDDVDDRALFSVGTEARVYQDQLLDYYHAHCHGHARDGMSVLALDVEDVQTLVAGVHGFLQAILAEREGPDGKRGADAPPFQFSLRIYQRVAGDMGVRKWLEAWQRRWDPARGQAVYPNCTLALAYRPAPEIADYMKLLEEDDATYDVAFLVRFMRTPEGGGDRMEPTQGFAFQDDPGLKFPITEAPRPATDSVQLRWYRQTNLSNRRLNLVRLHGELAARIKSGIQPQVSPDHLVFATVDYRPWAALVDRLHEGGRCRWVICLDPNVDRDLIATRANPADDRRAVVGFASGLGGLGELNVTVSTEAGTVGDLTTSFTRRLGGLFPAWSKDTNTQAARGLVDEATRIAGYSLVRAVTAEGDRRFREVVAQALVRRAYPADPTALCDVLIGLDAYRHWLAGGPPGGAKLRPDHIHLVAHLADDGDIVVTANVIECKLAEASDTPLEKARAQVRAGLEALVPNFLPAGHGDRRDAFARRYWWAQLQRAIATHSRIPADRASAVAWALERLGEGCFTITWRGTIATFWTDLAVGAGPGKTYPGPDWEDLGLLEMPADFVVGHLAVGNAAIAELATGAARPAVPATPGATLVPVNSRRGTGPLWRPSRPHAPAVAASPSAAPATPPPTPTPAPADDLPAPPKPEPAHVSAPSPVEAHGPSAIEATVPKSEHLAQPPETPARPDPSPTSTAVLIADRPATSGLRPAQVHTEELSPIPPRVLLGRTAGDRPVYWEFGHPGLTNRHLLIFGSSGSGKTYTIQCLLAELARAGQHAAIVDYTEGFLPTRLEPELKAVANPHTHFVRKEPLPINPLKPISSEDPDMGLLVESPHDTAGRVMSVFASVFNLGDQQKAKLVEAVKATLALHGDGARLEHLLAGLESLDGVSAASAQTLASRIRPFIEANAFGDERSGGWREVFTSPEHRLHVIQLARISREYARIATEFALWDLYSYATNTGSDRKPLPIVLDEAQTLSHDIDAPVGKILREGRKFGLAGIFATQTITNLKPDERAQLLQAGHLLFFAPAASEVREYAKILHDQTGDSVSEWTQRLATLEKGECWSYGLVAGSTSQRPKALRVRVTSLPARGLLEVAP